MKTPQITPLLRTILVACSLAACTAPEPPTPWESRLAPALCTRAESLLGEGDRDASRSTALRALEQAQGQGDVISEARALNLLGLVDQNPGQLKRSLQILKGAPLEGDLWQIRLALARLSLRAGELEVARAHIEAVLESSAEWPAPVQRARAEVNGYHMLARILRLEGDVELAAKHERWAALQLTVLPDLEEQELRQAVAQALGDDYADRALFDDAFQAHARAANLAAKLGEQRALLTASLCMSRDLIMLNRLADAIDHFNRTLSLARELNDWESMEQIALEALFWLDSRGEPWNSQRRHLFLDTLLDVSANTPDGDALKSSEDSTPPRG
ncbi:MAG: hypothetical protein P8N09_07075 [Planctomycetota bacterium]|jgi:tetratricopeptide (TPR) repeat protein|nr:hypothetical protein [Planctomycetota bacterium]